MGRTDFTDTLRHVNDAAAYVNEVPDVVLHLQADTSIIALNSGSRITRLHKIHHPCAITYLIRLNCLEITVEILLKVFLIIVWENIFPCRQQPLNL